MSVILRFGNLALFLFVVVIILSPFSLMGMDHHNHDPGDAVGCHFMLGETKTCTMDVFDHVVLLQTIFALPPMQFLFALAYLVLLLLLTVLLVRLFLTFGKLSRKRRRSNSNASVLRTCTLTNCLLGSTISPRAP